MRAVSTITFQTDLKRPPVADSEVVVAVGSEFADFAVGMYFVVCSTKGVSSNDDTTHDATVMSDVVVDWCIGKT